MTQSRKTPQAPSEVGTLCLQLRVLIEQIAPDYRRAWLDSYTASRRQSIGLHHHGAPDPTGDLASEETRRRSLSQAVDKLTEALALLRSSAGLIGVALDPAERRKSASVWTRQEMAAVEARSWDRRRR